MIKARLESQLRTVELEAEAAILIADGKIHPACASEEEAFELWLALTEWLSQPAITRPSARWQALLVALAHGRNAQAQDRRGQALPDFTSASTVLALAKEILGADAAEKLRRGMVDRMLGR